MAEIPAAHPTSTVDQNSGSRMTHSLWPWVSIGTTSPCTGNTIILPAQHTNLELLPPAATCPWLPAYKLVEDEHEKGLIVPAAMLLYWVTKGLEVEPQEIGGDLTWPVGIIGTYMP
uniref:Uncharacterized protein n=1 Tax=Oryza meridionalis TaxID=40149 RepID=A0A0E0F3F4_9ORYZ